MRKKENEGGGGTRRKEQKGWKSDEESEKNEIPEFPEIVTNVSTDRSYREVGMQLTDRFISIDNGDSRHS